MYNSELSSYIYQFNHSLVSNSLWTHGLQHARLPVHYQTHVNQVGGAIKPSHPLSSPSPPTFNLSQHQGLLPMSWFFASGGQSIRVSISLSVLPKNIQDWFPLGLRVWISLQSKGFSIVFSNSTVQKYNSLALSFLYSPVLTSIHDSWRNHSS